MNKVVLVGRLTRNPETRYSQGDNPTAISRYTLAVDRRFRREGQPDADFIRCVAFGRAGEFADRYFTQGMRVAVSGRILSHTTTPSFFSGSQLSSLTASPPPVDITWLRTPFSRYDMIMSCSICLNAAPVPRSVWNVHPLQAHDRRVVPVCRERRRLLVRVAYTACVCSLVELEATASSTDPSGSGKLFPLLLARLSIP